MVYIDNNIPRNAENDYEMKAAFGEDEHVVNIFDYLNNPKKKRTYRKV
jgi:hypothetical protein